MSIVGFEGDIGNRKSFQDLNTIKFKTEKAIRETWFSLGQDLLHEADQEILRKPKSGRTYIIRTKGGRRRRHVASAPGETHANLKGTLRKSISWKVHGANRLDFGYGFSTTASNKAPIYDSAIEDGNDDLNIEPRPSIANAVKAVKNKTNNHFKREMLQEFRRA